MVGFTTSGAAAHQQLFRSLGARIVVSFFDERKRRRGRVEREEGEDKGRGVEREMEEIVFVNSWNQRLF